jgi:UDP-N-acetylmuramate dehydrogenase
MALRIEQNVTLAPLTTFEIGGEARYFVDVASYDELVEALEWADSRGTTITILAGGSNVLVPDTGIDGLVIRITGTSHRWQNHTLIADAGCNMLSLIREGGEMGIGGWEKLAGIPGTLGGAVRGNAGAFGPEIKDFVREVKALHLDTREKRVFTNEQCAFSYRDSFFKRNPKWIIYEVTLDLLPVDPAHSAAAASATIDERERRHLQNVRAAGSFFMNPTAPQNIVEMFEQEKQVKSRESRVPAGWLIEKVGLKGHRVGGAIASNQHPNYIVNEHNASCQDVRNLAATIKQEVLNKFGVELHEEAALL